MAYLGPKLRFEALKNPQKVPLGPLLIPQSWISTFPCFKTFGWPFDNQVFQGLFGPEKAFDVGETDISSQ